MRLLAKTPEDRYQSARGLAADLARCAAEVAATGAAAGFVLGTADAPAGFSIPERLYGREEEAAALAATVAEVAEGGRALVLLSGAAGIGKTSLVGELRPALARHRCLAIEGKFDQFSRDVPYASLVAAFRGLIRQLLAGSDGDVAAWRERIRGTLGANLGVVAEVIPDLRLVVGDVPPAPAVGPQETQNRFTVVFRDFADLFARPTHPLMIFLDDLHWADTASLKLLTALLSDRDLRHLLVVGAYRPAEVSESHPLAVMLGDVDPAAVRRLDVRALGLTGVTTLVADTLRAGAPDLAEYLHDRTGGNPFFLRQVFESLAGDGLLRFESGAWTYDIEAVRAYPLTGDVVEFLAGKLAGLPPQTQEMLRLASVIGNRFDLATLAAVLGRSVVAVAGPLWPALAAGLVLPAGGTHELVDAGLDDGDVAYRFLHDRVQQACHSTIPPADLPMLHLRVGELMLAQLVGDEGLFDVVGHLNAAVELVTDSHQRTELARLNLRAGRKAAASTAYATADDLLARSATLLGDDVWATDYELAIDLHLLRGETLGALGDELFDCDPVEIRDGKLATREGMERGLRCLAAGQLEESARALRALVEVIPDDPVALDYLARATVARRARLLGHETLAPTAG